MKLFNKTLYWSLLVYLLATTPLLAQTIQWELYQGEKVGDSITTTAETTGAAFQQKGKNPKVWDYGVLEEQATGVRFFKCRNVGTTPLVITSIKTSCGCLIASAPKKPILPGEIAYIKSNYHTGRIGYFVKHITIHYYGEKEPIIGRLKIKGTVVAKR